MGLLDYYSGFLRGLEQLLIGGSECDASQLHTHKVIPGTQVSGDLQVTGSVSVNQSASQWMINGTSSAAASRGIQATNTDPNGSSIVRLANNNGDVLDFMCYGSTVSSNTNVSTIPAVGMSTIESQSANGLLIDVYTMAPMIFATWHQERMRILSNGNVLIGSTTETAGAEKLQVTGSTYVKGALKVETTGSGSQNEQQLVRLQNYLDPHLNVQQGLSFQGYVSDSYNNYGELATIRGGRPENLGADLWVAGQLVFACVQAGWNWLRAPIDVLTLTGDLSTFNTPVKQLGNIVTTESYYTRTYEQGDGGWIVESAQMSRYTPSQISSGNDALGFFYSRNAYFKTITISFRMCWYANCGVGLTAYQTFNDAFAARWPYSTLSTGLFFWANNTFVVEPSSTTISYSDYDMITASWNGSWLKVFINGVCVHTTACDLSSTAWHFCVSPNGSYIAKELRVYDYYMGDSDGDSSINGRLLIGSSTPTAGAEKLQVTGNMKIVDPPTGKLAIAVNTTSLSSFCGSSSWGLLLEGNPTNPNARSIVSRSVTTSNTVGGSISLYHNNTNNTLPVTGDRLGFIVFGGLDIAPDNVNYYGRNGAAIQAYAEENFVSGWDPGQPNTLLGTQQFGTNLRFETAPKSAAGAAARVERMRITANGNVLIGSTTETAGAEKLQVTGSISQTANADISVLNVLDSYGTIDFTSTNKMYFTTINAATGSTSINSSSFGITTTVPVGQALDRMQHAALNSRISISNNTVRLARGTNSFCIYGASGQNNGIGIFTGTHNASLWYCNTSGGGTISTMQGLGSTAIMYSNGVGYGMNATNMYGGNLTASLQPSFNASAMSCTYMYGVSGNAYINSTAAGASGTASYIIGVSAGAYVAGTGGSATVTTMMIGADCNAFTGDTSGITTTVPLGIGVRASAGCAATGGNMTTAYGILIKNGTQNGVNGGVITNQYGLYIEDQTLGATSKWNIYVPGSSSSYHGGNFLIGSSTPTSGAEKLQVTGIACINNSGTSSLPNATSTATAKIYGVVGTNARNVVVTVGGNPQFLGVRYNGTYGSYTPVVADNVLASLIGTGGYDTTGTTSDTAPVGIHLYASENWSSTATGTYIRFQTTQNGTAFSSVARMFILNNGNVLIGAGSYLSETAGAEKLQVTGTASFGNSSSGANATIIESDGSLTFKGTATVWNDAFVDGLALTADGTNPPTVITLPITGSVAGMRFEDAKVQVVHGSIEIPHDYKEGTDLYVHIHWLPSSTNSGNCRWGVEWTIASVGGVFPATTISEVDAPAGGVTAAHRVVDVVTISGTNRKISDVIHFRVHRNGTHANDTFTGNAFLSRVAIHYECDMVGSRSQTTKA